MTEPLRVVLYARVSTDNKDQDPETQLDIIRPIAERRGYKVVGEYMDFKSGKDANRPQWKIVMDMARNGQIDGIMALRLDRIMRSVMHLCEVIKELEKYNVRLIFSDLEFDPKNPNSALTINILSAIAQWEREIIYARVKEGMNHRKSKGQVFGKAKRDIPVHGLGWKTIADQLDIPRTTIKGREEDINAEIEKIKGVSDNPAGVEGVSDGVGV